MAGRRSVVLVKTADIAEILNELKELRKEVQAVRSTVTSQAKDIKVLNEQVRRLSGQNSVHQYNIFPLSNLESFQEMHRRITVDRDAKHATQIFNEVRSIIKFSGCGLNSDLVKCFEALITRDLAPDVNWNGSKDKKAMRDHWLFKFCLPKVLEIQPGDTLMMEIYESKIIAAHNKVRHRLYTYKSRKKAKTAEEQSSKMVKTEFTDEEYIEEALDEEYQQSDEEYE